MGPTGAGMARRHENSSPRVALSIGVDRETDDLRRSLVEIAVRWQQRFGVAPAITTAISELDAALLIGMDQDEYSRERQRCTAVRKGYDFIHRGWRYQVKAHRSSGGRGSFVTLVGKAQNFEWDKLIWILYDRIYVMQEAWEWNVRDYRLRFEDVKRLAPKEMRLGRRLFSPETTTRVGLITDEALGR